jgi:NADH dehydrogenase FAD-containing subunit
MVLPTTVDTPAGTITLGSLASITVVHNGHEHTFTDAVVAVAANPYGDDEVRYEIQAQGATVGFEPGEVTAFTA